MNWSLRLIQRRSSRCLFLLLLCSSATPLIHGQVKTVTIDGSSKGRTFDGIGALSAGASSRLLMDYQEPYRSQILDYLFKPGYGAALQHLKVEIGGDVNSTDGSEPSHMRTPSDRDFTRGYEWWLIQEARKRNPQIILDTLPWGAPGWVGHGNYYSSDMAHYVADFLEAAKKQYGLDIAYTGVWNEKQFDAKYVKELHHVLRERHITAKIVCCDEYAGEGLGQWGIVDAMNNDPALKEAVDVVGVHYSLVNGKYTTPDSARNLGKPLWSSEDQPNSGAGPILSRDWPIGGRILARLFNLNYLEGGFTKTEIWSPVTSYYDILAAPNSGLMYANTPWSGYYNVQGAIWATAHTTQFAQPGWKYLDSSSGRMPEQGSYVTLKAPNGKDWSIVLETIDAKQSQDVIFEIEGGLSGKTVHVWETNGQKIFEHVADVTPQHNKFQYKFDPDSLYSLTTTTGQGRGAAQPPAPNPFPNPYIEHFESTELQRAPRFLSDQNGAFEVRPCLQREGRCLDQVIVDKPIPWGPQPDPFTLAGDTSWSDYQIACDVLIVDGPVTLIGRIDSADVFRDGTAIWPSGYVFSVHPRGAWALSSAAYKVVTRTLASGNMTLAADKWHRFVLKFHGLQITASIDGNQVATVTDSAHVAGMFGIGTGWNRAQFDNLAVTKE
jgi:Glycosyl hydrolase family 59/Galactocerebrosidase, C-terminal lectin domain